MKLALMRLECVKIMNGGGVGEGEGEAGGWGSNEVVRNVIIANSVISE